MQSAEFWKFPCHITPESIFGDKKSVTEKVLLLYERRKFIYLNLFQSERPTVLPQV